MSLCKEMRGLPYRGKSYEEELAEKKKWVVDNIGKYCGKINDIVGMYYPYHYRNKVHAVFGRRMNN